MTPADPALALVAVAAGVFLYVDTASPPWYERLRYPLHYEEIVRGHARNYGLDPAFLAAVIYAESKFDANARSGSGAIGLMQLTPETAKGIAIRTGGDAFRLSDLTTPRSTSATAAGTCATFPQVPATSASSSPPTTRVRATSTSWLRKGQSIQFPETNAYVDRVEELKDVYREAYRDELYP